MPGNNMKSYYTGSASDVILQVDTDQKTIVVDSHCHSPALVTVLPVGLCEVIRLFLLFLSNLRGDTSCPF
ncbi:hypothetical protein LSAT2_019229, partial [Lamellibrachia satsuma]